MNSIGIFFRGNSSVTTEGKTNSTVSKHEPDSLQANGNRQLETISELANGGESNELENQVKSYMEVSSSSLGFSHQAKDDLLDLALEFHLHDNKKAAHELAKAIDKANEAPYSKSKEENYYTLTECRSETLNLRSYIKNAADTSLTSDGGNRKVAEFAIGLWHLEGNNYLKHDPKQALVHIKSSADKGYEPAIQFVEHCDKFGEEKALLLYKYDKGDCNATFQLGELALQEAKPDNETAIAYITMAKRNGHVDASFKLAEIYAKQYEQCTSTLLNGGLRDKAVKNYEEAAKGNGKYAGVDGEAARKLLEFKVAHCEDSYANAKGELFTSVIGKTRIIGNEVTEKTITEQNAKAKIEAQAKAEAKAKLEVETKAKTEAEAKLNAKNQAKLEAKERAWEEKQNARLEAQFLKKEPKSVVNVYEPHEEL